MPNEHDVTHEAVREHPERYVQLSDHDGVETWLDTTTGLQLGFASGEFTGVIENAAEEDIAGEAPEEEAEALIFARPLRDTMRAMLDSYGYKYDQITDDALHMVVRGASGLVAVVMIADDARDLVRVIGSYGPAVPVDRRPAVAEAASRVNVRTSLGNFELDFSDGELRFRVCTDVENGLFSEKMADNMVGCTLHTMNRFAEAFMRIAFGDADPEEVLAGVP